MKKNSASTDLMALARARPEDRDATLLRAATALFCQEPIHDRDAVRRFEQLAVHLLPKVTPHDRAYVASLLGGRRDAPASLIRALARDEISVAGPVIRKSPVLSTIDILGIIAAKGADHHRLIAGRPDLNADVLRALAIARDRDQESEPEQTGDLTGTQPDDRSPAAEPAPRAMTDPEFAAFLDASTERRLQILADVSARRWRSGRTAPDRTLDGLLRKTFTTAEIVTAARSGNRDRLIDSLSRALEIEAEVTTRLLEDQSGEPLVLMIKAAGLNLGDGRTVLMLASKRIGESVDEFFRLADLYASLEAHVAEAFIETWRPATPQRRPTHMPVFSEPAERAATAPAVQERDRDADRKAG